MLELRTPNGLRAQVPETVAEDASPHFSADDFTAIKAYYQLNGYAVIKNMLDATTCDTVRGWWRDEIKPSPQPLYRQETSKLTRHRFNDQGWVMNPILNPHSVDPKLYPQFRKAVREQILNSVNAASLLQSLFNERPKIVQAMYFEGNSETWEHQDSYYLDSEQIGTMVGIWFALEDIAPTAGRFFICPQSHLFDWPKRSLKDNVVDAHDHFIKQVIETIRNSGAAVHSPALRKGDAIIWNACTIHGSLGTQDETQSRSSITCHAIPASHRFMTLHHYVTDVATQDMGNILLHSPKDLAQAHYRIIKWAEQSHPRLFWAVKKRLRRLQIRITTLVQSD